MMPPPDGGTKRLTAEEIALFRTWIARGAEYERHWAFEPPREVTPPKMDDESWATGDLDHFVLRSLHDHGVRPNPPASRPVLARRAFLDLTGLPPTPEEVDRFVADERPDAYERLIDRLLTTEPYRSRYAERMATPWLDLARYADTAGIHMDAGKQMWPYRDWVLRAFRDNMRFDRFTIDQIAGDLVEDPTLDQLIASGFHRNHVTSDEGGAIEEEYLLEYAVDRVETTGAVWLGLTVGCARCHDHKFDPITQEDFYGLVAFFNNVEQPGIYSQLPDANRAFEPAIELPRDVDRRRLERIALEIARVEAERTTPTPEETIEIRKQLDRLRDDGGDGWISPPVVSATSRSGATMDILDDGSVLVSGASPANDEHVLTYRLEDGEYDLLLLEALTHDTLLGEGTGRAGNGNAILSAIEIEAVSVTDPSRRRTVEPIWAWADHEQSSDDFRITNALRKDNGRVWAADSHRVPGQRTLAFMTEDRFGFDGGTDVRITLTFESPYPNHVLGRTRASFGRAGEMWRRSIPVATTNWYIVGPYAIENGTAGYDTRFGPEGPGPIDFTRDYQGQKWRYAPGVVEGEPVNLAQGLGAEFVGREIWSPNTRTLPISLGSDDGIQVFHDGKLVFERRVDRGVAPDQDRLDLALHPGRNTIVLKIVNTGGPGALFHRTDPGSSTLPSPSIAAILPEETVREPARALGLESIRSAVSPRYRELVEAEGTLTAERDRILASVPKTSVMKERAEPRPTYVMMRGLYDAPDLERRVERRIPEALGTLPSVDGTPSRLDLARWLVSRDNPLTARVVVNRLWNQIFGRGIVGSIEDFGYQSSWPTHPELLDHLATRFQDEGWDLQWLLREIMTSATYRQAARRRPDLAAVDPENELLGSFPRQRLEAEQIRDQALFVADLLVESFGGPSVKPYQPDGLWREVAMLQSNTRTFEQGTGDDLHRRSVYTYWKRACPPPSLLALDAPTREYCSVQRLPTNTPLQALVLWNDPQFVEASRMLAARVLGECTDDVGRIERLFRHVTAEPPSDELRDAALETLQAYRIRYDGDPGAARSLCDVGDEMSPADLPAVELAAWTMVANAVLASDAAIVRD